MKPQEFARWKKIRDRGMLRFIFVTGILSFGLPMFVVLNFTGPSQQALSLVDIVVLLLICAVAGGSAFGYILWLVQERRYRKALERSKA